jgi:ABC-2 type transport system ATP-binding protein
MDALVEARGLTKVYNPGGAAETRALDNVDFHVHGGEIFGLIGADGAGKTTAFKILAGVLEQTEGTVNIAGGSPRDKRDQIGYLTQPFSLYQDLSVIENLRYAAGLRELPEAEFDNRRRRYLGLFDMQRFEGRLASQLSGGMKQKLALSCALIFNPRLLLLDEPTTGVDPVSRRDFWDALTALSGEGITIIVATPYFDEAERCHRIALMEQGKVLQTDSPSDFRAKLGMTRLEVRTSALALAAEALGQTINGAISDVQRFGDRLDVMVRSADKGAAIIGEKLGAAGLDLRDIRHASPTLENAFVATMRRLRGRESLPPFPEHARRPEPEAHESAAIEAANLKKTFGSFHAVKDFSVTLRYGEVYGLLGANGAGKTTAIKMICGLLKPSDGQVLLLGRRKRLRSAEVRSQIGYMSQKFTLYDDLTIGENLDFYASLYGVPENVRKLRKDWVLEISGLSGEQNLLTRQLPGGWKQRVAFGAAVMHEPRVIFLDEPTSGVDPLARRVMWRMINELADHGSAVLVVTHYLEEAEQCNRLGFMVAGEMLVQGSPGEVKAGMSGRLLEVETSSARQALPVFQETFGKGRVSLFGDRLHVIVDSAETGIRRAREALAANSIECLRADEIDFSLEDVFISLIEGHRQSIPQ